MALCSVVLCLDSCETWRPPAPQTWRLHAPRTSIVTAARPSRPWASSASGQLAPAAPPSFRNLQAWPGRRGQVAKASQYYFAVRVPLMRKWWPTSMHSVRHKDRWGCHTRPAACCLSPGGEGSGCNCRCHGGSHRVQPGHGQALGAARDCRARGWALCWRRRCQLADIQHNRVIIVAWRRWAGGQAGRQMRVWAREAAGRSTWWNACAAVCQRPLFSDPCQLAPQPLLTHAVELNRLPASLQGGAGIGGCNPKGVHRANATIKLLQGRGRRVAWPAAKAGMKGACRAMHAVHTGWGRQVEGMGGRRPTGRGAPCRRLGWSAGRLEAQPAPHPTAHTPLAGQRFRNMSAEQHTGGCVSHPCRGPTCAGEHTETCALCQAGRQAGSQAVGTPEQLRLRRGGWLALWRWQSQTPLRLPAAAVRHTRSRGLRLGSCRAAAHHCRAGGSCGQAGRQAACRQVSGVGIFQ